ncbi:MAG: protein kinase [Acidobacteria bacterium]|nr:protein kinase [Acidobacteriota bacterium]MCA1627295.1 protein kinase [Acidobacteriota bacterium]
MAMNVEQWQRVKELCLAALTRRSHAREAYLQDECGDDPELLAEVRSLLAFETQANDGPPELPVQFVAAAFGSYVSLVGTTIGTYKVRGLLGSGGMGEVYLADDTELARKVALKVLPQELTQDEQRLQRFKQEARAASGLKHRNIITIYSVGQANGIHFIATEYVNGVTLRQRLANSGRLELKPAVDVALQIASALEAAHSARIVHRDVKPENIMFEPDGTVKLLDFGIAKLIETLNSENTSTAGPPKTEQGVVLGTPAYMSPEQARHEPVDHRSDLFSLGVVLYEMITGTVPFAGKTPYDQQAAVLVAEPTPLQEHLDRCVSELRWVMSKVLAKDPERRYQTATDLIIDLQMLSQTLQQDETEARDDSRAIVRGTENKAAVTSRRANWRWNLQRRPKFVAVAVLILLVTLTAAAGLLTRPGQRVAAALGLLGPSPVIESIVPNRPIDIIGNQPIKVRGRYFQDGLRVKVGFPNGGSTELSGAQIQKQEGESSTFNIVVDLNGNPGTYTLQLINPDGQVSSPFTFETRHEMQRPSIDWIEPAAVIRSGGEQLIAVYGKNFQHGVRVEVIQPNGETSELRDRQIANRTPGSFHGLFFFHLPGKHTIRAVNPNGGKSEYFDIVVQ